MLTLKLSNENKVEILHKFIEEQISSLGGLVMALIIPPKFEDMMLDFNKTAAEPESDFYIAGWYNCFEFPVYIDVKLENELYLIGNAKIFKVKVEN